MSDLRSNLRRDFHDKDFRHVYAEESLNTYIATQIKVLREQQGLTQAELATLSGMKQPRIAVLEDINYSSWSINTLRRLAKALDLRLSVQLDTFSSLIPELETFSRPALERSKFSDDSFFHEVHDAVAMQQGGAFGTFDNVIPADVFQEHMRLTATRQKGQGQNFPDPQSITGGRNEAFSSAIG